MIVKIKPTKLGICFAGFIVLVYMFSLMSQTGLLYFIIGILFGIIVVNILLASWTVSAAIPCEIGRIRVEEGSKTEASITVLNKAKKTYGMYSLSLNKRRICNFLSLAAQKENHSPLDLTMLSRGIYPVKMLKAESCFPFGLVSASKKVSAFGSFIIYPKVYACSPPLASGFKPTLGGKHKGVHKSIFGDDFSGVREYRVGDPVKFIHWKASSKGNGLFTKEFNEEYSGMLTIILDTYISQKNTLPVFESMLRSACSVVFAALDSGDSILVSDFSGRHTLKVSPFSDSNEVLDYFAALKPVEESSESSSYKLHATKSTVAIFITEFTSLSKTFVESIDTQRIKVSIFLPESKIERKISSFSNETSIYFYSDDKTWKN